MKRNIAWVAASCFLASAAMAQAPEILSNTPAQSATPGDREKPKDFGTPSFNTALDSYAMQPYNNGFINNRAGNSNTGNLSCSVASTESRAVGQIQMPHGVDIEAVSIWGTDNSAGANVRAQLISSCLPDFAAGFPVLTTLATAASTGTPGAFRDLATGLPPGINLVDNQSCTYRVEVRLGPDESTCDVNLFFSKLRIQWGRTIPPAPAVATFTDVPLGSQFFGEVEAFVDTGVTSGCTGSTFCPNDFVTRLQMAAFFARALGLPPANIVDPANP